MRDVCRATLLGSAIGDALGAPAEFLSRSEILARFGDEGIVGFEPWDGFPRGSWTDDTQLTLATARGLVEAAVVASRQAVSDPMVPVFEEYLAWLSLQDEPLHRRRPGHTCLTALRGGKMGTFDAPLNQSKGAGGIMRVAPVGLVAAPERAFEMGAEVAALTHGHPTGWLAAGFFADVASRVVRGDSLPGAIADTRELLIGWDDFDETLEKVDHAVELFMCDADLDRGLESLGEGWVAEEALGMALYCSLSFPGSFDEAVRCAVNITGDSDTVGCLTGALMGAILGLDEIPETWKEQLEGVDEIVSVADALCDAHRIR